MPKATASRWVPGSKADGRVTVNGERANTAPAETATAPLMITSNARGYRATTGLDNFRGRRAS